VVIAVLTAHVVHHLTAAGVAEVHIDIGHGHPLRIQKPLEVQIVLHGVDVRNPQAIGHHGPCGGAAPRSYRDVHALGIAHEVGHDQEVVSEPHLFDHVQLVVQLLAVLRPVAVPLDEPLIAQLPQIRGGVVALRQLEFRQVVLAEGELQLAHVCDALGVGHCVGVPRKQRLHLLRGPQIEVLGLVAHPVLVIHGLARLDAQKHIVALGVLLPEIVGIVGTHQRNARLVVEPQQLPVHLGLVGDTVVLQLQIKAVLTEDVPHGQGVFLRPVIVTVQYSAGDLTGQTSRQRNKALGVFPQQVHVDTGLDVKAFGECLTHHIGQIPIACLVLAQQHQMAALRIELVLLIEAGPPRHIHLAPDDGMDALLFAGAVEVNNAVHHTVIRDGHRVLPHLLYQRRQIPYSARTVQQAVFRMDMQMYKAHVSPSFRISQANSSSISHSSSTPDTTSTRQCWVTPSSRAMSVASRSFSASRSRQSSLWNRAV